MKILFEDYTFNASAKQIRFNTTSVIGLEQLLIITNVTDNIIIYNFADPSAGGTISNNVLTLDYNTVSMSNTDSLQIFIDSLLSPASDEMLQSVQEQTALLMRMVKLLEPSSVQGTSGRQQVDINVVNSAVLSQNYQTYYSGLASTSLINTAESIFNLQSRIAYATLRQNLEFS
jgi:hypothetical protein